MSELSNWFERLSENPDQWAALGTAWSGQTGTLQTQAQLLASQQLAASRPNPLTGILGSNTTLLIAGLVVALVFIYYHGKK